MGWSKTEVLEKSLIELHWHPVTPKTEVLEKAGLNVQKTLPRLVYPDYLSVLVAVLAEERQAAGKTWKTGMVLAQTGAGVGAGNEGGVGVKAGARDLVGAEVEAGH